MREELMRPAAEVRLAPAQTLEEAARSYVRAGKAANTLRAYRADFADFTLWCKKHARESLPAEPETICLYVTTLAEGRAKATTIQRRLPFAAQTNGVGSRFQPHAAVSSQAMTSSGESASSSVQTGR